MLTEAIALGLSEADDLDWKARLPPSNGINTTDFPKDIAAMANSGGGTIVYGITETGKAATGRTGLVEFSEGQERSLRSAAITAISPPVFGLSFYAIGEGPELCVVVEIPASVDGPHLIYRNDYFGAPIRNGADTVWMRERQIEAMYRARFNERRLSTDSLAALYAESAQAHPSADQAWLIAIACPRVPAMIMTRPERSDARELFEAAERLASTLTNDPTRNMRPLGSTNTLNPRAGLRRWTAPNTAEGSTEWRSASASLHHDGSVTLCSAAGGRRTVREQLAGHVVDSLIIELAVADFLALVRTAGSYFGTSDYSIMIGLEWQGAERLVLQTVDLHGYPYDGSSVPLASYTPVFDSIDSSADEVTFRTRVFEIAQDCVNQGGIVGLRALPAPLTGTT